ncbi:MAG: hypothetical protein ACI9LM_000123 [Alteromonadaceae bacterium]|jgi:hypothetical protein
MPEILSATIIAFFCWKIYGWHKGIVSEPIVENIQLIKIKTDEGVVYRDFGARRLLNECVSNLSAAKELDDKIIFGGEELDFELVANARERDKLLARAKNLNALNG